MPIKKCSECVSSGISVQILMTAMLHINSFTSKSALLHLKLFTFRAKVLDFQSCDLDPLIPRTRVTEILSTTNTFGT